MPETCAICGGTLERRTISHTQPWGGHLYQFEDVPALVCLQCGEVWLPAEVSQRIDAIIKSQAAPARYEQVPVFSLSGTASPLAKIKRLG